MDTSRRAVESYWRSRMIDAVTSDEDKVAPVYKLEELCDLLRSSHVPIVKEFSEFILKRLDNKSPIVKQKALRLIKYSVGKSGSEFRREMQRNSVAVRNLVHYKGHPDPLKGDALNKAVRDTAQETISAIFSEENGSKPASAPESINRRIEGFGNTNFQVASNDNKSFLSEVVGIGSASIKQGISSFAQGHLQKRNENGSHSYRGPNLHRSLTLESENSGRYDPVKLGSDGMYGASKNTGGGSWGHGSGEANESSGSVRLESKTREEKLLETVVTSGGVRLQPTRDALHVFILEAAKMDAVALSVALDGKLQSPLWQVRMKALCVLEAILRKKDDDNLSIVHTYFNENTDVIQRCADSPQSSLREKANKVLSLLNGGQSKGIMSSSENTVKRDTAVNLPDLIDTGDSDYTTEDTLNMPATKSGGTLATAAPLMDGDWFGDSTDTGLSSSEKKNDDDPFADVSFHPNEEKESADDLFSGMIVGEKPAAGGNQVPELFDMFGSTSTLEAEPKDSKNINDLMASFSIDETNSNQKGTSSRTVPENLFAMPPSITNQHAQENPVGGMLGLQSSGFSQNQMIPGGVMPLNFPPGMMMNPAFASQPFNYAAMASLLAQQQQYLGNLSNFQQFGNMNAHGTGNVLPMGTSEGNQSAFPDIFQPNFANQAPTSTMDVSKKQDTRAFDFISDHLASARDTKRVS